MQKTCFIGAFNSQINNYHNRRKVLSIFSLLFAVVGIALMIVEIELSSYDTSHSPRLVSLIIKLTVSISTVVLMMILVMYHRVSFLLYMAENGVHNWRLVISCKWLLMVITELTVCSIHPFPLPNYSYIWITTRDYQGVREQEMVPVNVILTIIMFFRGYLIFRVMVLHCYIYNNTFQGGLDLIQKRNINTQFAVKYLLTVYSRGFLIFGVISLFLWTSWSIRVCEIYERKMDFGFFKNVWFIAITFLTIGYGDIVPFTVCGRFVAVMAGTFGVVCTAYVVAIIAESMQLTYSETYLHRFVIRSELDERMKHSAAAIFQNTWLIKRAQKNKDVKNMYKYILECRRKLLKHIQKMKVLKNEKIQVEKKSLSISTIYNGQMQIYSDIDKLHSRIIRIESLTSKVLASVDHHDFKV